MSKTQMVWKSPDDLHIAPSTRKAINYLLGVCDTLATKGVRYGELTDTLQVFAEVDLPTSIRHRIDQKLTRIKNLPQLGADVEDSLSDLIGYFALLHVLENNND